MSIFRLGFDCRMLFACIAICIAAPAEQAKADDPCPVVAAPSNFLEKGRAADNAATPGNRGIVPAGFVALSADTPVVHGIDVSKWQASADFVRVKKCGGAFAYVRMSAGKKLDNELEYRSHWSNARSVGLFLGPYHNFTLADPKRSILELSSDEVGTVEKETVTAARDQAANFLRQLREVLSLDEKPGSASALGEPILPIALDVTARPLSQKTPEAMQAFGQIYAKAICAWFDTVRADVSFKQAPLVIFTMPRLFHDFGLAAAPCIGALKGIWVSHRPSDGSRIATDDETQEHRLNHELCVGRDGRNRCIFEQYTSWGGFALYQPSEGLDLNRFLGSESELQSLLYQAQR